MRMLFLLVSLLVSTVAIADEPVQEYELLATQPYSCSDLKWARELGYLNVMLRIDRWLATEVANSCNRSQEDCPDIEAFKQQFYSRTKQDCTYNPVLELRFIVEEILGQAPSATPLSGSSNAFGSALVIDGR